MSKRKIGWNEKKIQRYLKEGRGKGREKDHKPWTTIQDFPSIGRASRTSGWKTGRVHHFMSDNETRYLYLLEWSDVVTDIREQFPLLDLDEVIVTVEEMGVQYPLDRDSKTPLILTTDFMVTLNLNGKEIDVARRIKPYKELDKKRVVEKLEIERRYWSKKNVDWGVVTEKEIRKVLASNIEWVYSAYRLEPTSELDIDGPLALASTLKERLIKRWDYRLNEVLNELDKEMNLETGTTLYVFRHLVASKEIAYSAEIDHLFRRKMTSRSA